MCAKVKCVGFLCPRVSLDFALLLACQVGSGQKEVRALVSILPPCHYPVWTLTSAACLSPGAQWLVMTFWLGHSRVTSWTAPAAGGGLTCSRGPCASSATSASGTTLPEPGWPHSVRQVVRTASANPNLLSIPSRCLGGCVAVGCLRCGREDRL